MLKFKKIASLLASTLMVGSTVGLAAAANYPAPFVQGGSPNVGIVYGADAAITDLVAATNIMDNLNSYVVGGTDDTPTQVSGDAYALFTSSTPLLLNQSMNTVRSTVTETNLPSILGETDFSGDVDANIEFKIDLGSNPRTIFAKQPSSSDDPAVGILMGTTAGNYLYNATATFNKVVNFTKADSQGEDITLFGQDFTVSSATDTTSLVLFRSSETVFLDSNSNPSQTVTVDGEEFTVELVSASDTSATVRLTDSSGAVDQKEINEAASKKILGIEVAVDNADELGDGTVNAEIILGASRIKLQDGSEVLIGTDEDTIEGTQVSFNGAGPSNMLKITVQVFAADGDEDFITPETSFTDPVFGTFKVDFSGLTSDDDRETIEVKSSGNDKMTVAFTNWQNNELTSFEWVNNESTAFLGDSSEWPIVVEEMRPINESAYAVVGNEEDGYLVNLRTLTNNSGSGSNTYSNDKVVFENVFDTSQTWEASITGEGTGTIDIGGTSFTVTYYDPKQGNGDQFVRLNSPDTAGNDMLLYPTIETSKGAKLAFYEPRTIVLDNWDGTGADVDDFHFPDGDGYTEIVATAPTDAGNWTINSVALDTSRTGLSVSATVGQLTYNFTTTGTINQTRVYLTDVSGGNIVNPALVLFEEQDEANNYEAVIIQTGGAGTSDNGIGVSDVDFTWNDDANMATGAAYGSSGLQRESDDDLYDMMDVWGTMVTTDQSTSDQYTATVHYNDNQVTSELFVAAEDATITGGSSGSSGGGTTVGVPMLDSEVTSSSGNLIVVGGSCVNTVAASLLGSSTPLCGADFTTETTVGAGQFLIETFSRSGSNVATLVAGYNAGDTTNAATFLRTQTVDTMVGKKYVGTSSTSAELVTETSSDDSSDEETTDA